MFWIPYNCTFNLLKDKVCTILELPKTTILKNLYYHQFKFNGQGQLMYHDIKISIDPHVYQIINCKFYFLINTSIELYAKFTRSSNGYILPIDVTTHEQWQSTTTGLFINSSTVIEHNLSITIRKVIEINCHCPLRVVNQKIMHNLIKSNLTLMLHTRSIIEKKKLNHYIQVCSVNNHETTLNSLSKPKLYAKQHLTN